MRATGCEANPPPVGNFRSHRLQDIICFDPEGGAICIRFPSQPVRFSPVSRASVLGRRVRFKRDCLDIRQLFQHGRVKIRPLHYGRLNRLQKNFQLLTLREGVRRDQARAIAARSADPKRICQHLLTLPLGHLLSDRLALGDVSVGLLNDPPEIMLLQQVSDAPPECVIIHF